MEVTRDNIIDILTRIPDPEVPAINIVELGVVRDASMEGDKVNVTITPTYSGCPAMKMIEDQIYALLQQEGFTEVSIKTVFSPAWTTDWLSDEAKRKLKEYGIAPPGKTSPQQFALFAPGQRQVDCPFCDSANTTLKSEFGSTACKALYYCNSCQQPFEHFKCI